MRWAQRMEGALVPWESLGKVPHDLLAAMCGMPGQSTYHHTASWASSHSRGVNSFLDLASFLIESIPALCFLRIQGPTKMVNKGLATMIGILAVLMVLNQSGLVTQDVVKKTLQDNKVTTGQKSVDEWHAQSLPPPWLLILSLRRAGMARQQGPYGQRGSCARGHCLYRLLLPGLLLLGAFLRVGEKAREIIGALHRCC